MTYSSVNEYINSLKKSLVDFPTNERASILEEIEVHLNEKINDLIKSGYSNEAAINKVLTEFKPPQELSEEYLKDNYKTNDHFQNTTSIAIINIGLFGLSFLALPILKESLDLAFIIFGGLLTLIFVIIVTIKKHWKPDEIKTVNVIPKVILYLLSPASMLFLWISIKSSEGIVMFSLYYMFVYWIILLLIWLFVKLILKKIRLQ
ncbi:hypothetical protein GMD78_19295 [Ornithinibacillus sp. L9]|uniref:DUF1700 domain-containing protein n=1 Tax=Ornithinibacillus caprae TaxID=2678566 RepID=A0A6N8FQC2_9BACI|nr:permease prefix domain 1-containing protein [Ornithinibacillus caprae]MUK90507.1 hypothetical protein [Ornithinibacillus caprae]